MNLENKPSFNPFHSLMSKEHVEMFMLLSAFTLQQFPNMQQLGSPILSLFNLEELGRLTKVAIQDKKIQI